MCHTPLLSTIAQLLHADSNWSPKKSFCDVDYRNLRLIQPWIMDHIKYKIPCTHFFCFRGLYDEWINNEKSMKIKYYPIFLSSYQLKSGIWYFILGQRNDRWLLTTTEGKIKSRSPGPDTGQTRQQSKSQKSLETNQHTIIQSREGFNTRGN